MYEVSLPHRNFQIKWISDWLFLRGDRHRKPWYFRLCLLCDLSKNEMLPPYIMVSLWQLWGCSLKSGGHWRDFVFLQVLKKKKKKKEKNLFLEIAEKTPSISGSAQNISSKWSNFCGLLSEHHFSVSFVLKHHFFETNNVWRAQKHKGAQWFEPTWKFDFEALFRTIFKIRVA